MPNILLQYIRAETLTNQLVSNVKADAADTFWSFLQKFWTTGFASARIYITVCTKVCTILLPCKSFGKVFSKFIVNRQASIFTISSSPSTHLDTNLQESHSTSGCACFHSASVSRGFKALGWINARKHTTGVSAGVYPPIKPLQMKDEAPKMLWTEGEM